MHAMSSRHSHHHFQHHHQQSPIPQPVAPYQATAASAALSAAASHQRQQHRSPAPFLVAPHSPHSSTRSRSPIFATPSSSAMPRPESPAPPSASAHSNTRDTALVPPSTPRLPEDVVMTSTINFTRDTRDRPIINQYLIGHRLGTGQHGEVYKGFDMRRGNMVVAIKACKRKNPKEAKHEQLRQRNQGPIPRTVGGFGGVSARPRLVDQVQSTEKKVLREIAIMKKCKHGQIVQLYEVINDRLTNKILLIMEYMGGGEVKWRDDHNRPCLRVDQTRRICRDVVLGLLYLHHQGIIHRDIKPANLLWTADRKNVKITDFGVSHFSAAQRIDALKHTTAYREALERRKQILRRREEEASGIATPGRRRAPGWPGRGSGSTSKEDIKGKGRARDDPTASSPALTSDLSSPTSATEDAAAEKDLLNEIAGDVDPILLDDGGLSRQAGTPSFLAPEIIWEFGEKHTAALYKKVGLTRLARDSGTRNSESDLSKTGDNVQDTEREEVETAGRDGGDMDKAPALSMTTSTKTPRRIPQMDDEATPRVADEDGQHPLNLPSELASIHLGETQETMPDPDPASFHDPNAAFAEAEAQAVADDLDLPPRPQITKAIDVWALGVTLYCLLFGRTPWGGVTEFAMYQMIHTDDFVVDEVMGFDRVPTGGRFHDKLDTSEGAIVIGLLDRLLEKDCTERITLEEVKRLSWITRDIPNPDEWVEETAPALHDPIRITSADEDVAMTTVKFRWWSDMTKPFRRFRSLLPAARTVAARQQQQAHHRRAEDRSLHDVELSAMLQGSLHNVESDFERTGRTIGLQRKASKSRRVIDAVERGVQKISRHGSAIYNVSAAGGETPRSMKRRTLPDLMIGSRERSMSRSRDGSQSRPHSRASGPATPRGASGGSTSNLTSPSTAGFTSDGETDILDADDVQAVRASRKKERKDWEREKRHNASARQSLNNFSKILTWLPKGSPRASLSESSSKGSLGLKGLTRSPASAGSPAGGNGRESGAVCGIPSARTSFATQRLARRSADEFGAARHRIGHGGANVPGTIDIRSDSGRTISSAGVATSSRALALASAGELSNVMRASSWGDVADEFGYEYGYGATPRGGYEVDADGVSDYGFGSGSAYGDYMYGSAGGYGYGGSDVDAYPNDDDEVRLVGAGGILSHPVSGPSSPNSLSGVSVGTGLGIPSDGFSLQGVAHDVGTGVVAPAPVSAGAQVVVSSAGVNALPLLQTQLQDTGRRRGTSVGSRTQLSHHIPHVVSSPLAQSPLSVDRDSPSFDSLELDAHGDLHIDRPRRGHESPTKRNRNGDAAPSSVPGSGSASRSGSNLASSSGSGSETSGIRIFGQGATRLRVDDEVPDIEVFEESSSEEETQPIVVRRRRPSEILARSQSRSRQEKGEGAAAGTSGGSGVGGGAAPREFCCDVFDDPAMC